MYKVSIIGLGYVGLSLSTFLASKGIHVWGYDKARWKLESLKKGKLYISEEDLETEFNRAVSNGLFHISEKLEESITHSNITFICVDTPTKEDWRQDYSSIISAAKSIGKILGKLDRYHLIVVKSTLLPESSRKIIIPAIEQESGLLVGRDFGYIYNPEFLREGKALYDLRSPNRIVIGEYDNKSGDIIYAFYKEIYDEKTPIFRMTIENAELLKYVSNVFLSLKISFINLIARVCEKTPNTDINIISEALKTDPRIGPYLQAGIGFGGQCLPKDLKAFISFVEEIGIKSALLREIYFINEEQAIWPINILKQVYHDLKDKVICILGLTFKPNTNDIRNSQSIKIISRLLDEGAVVKIYDPEGLENFLREYYYLPVIPCNSIEKCLEDTDAVIIATDWDEFKLLEPKTFKKLMKTPLIIDGRRIYDVNKFKDDVIYFGVGYHSRPFKTLLEI